MYASVGQALCSGWLWQSPAPVRTAHGHTSVITTQHRARLLRLAGGSGWALPRWRRTAARAAWTSMAAGPPRRAHGRPCPPPSRSRASSLLRRRCAARQLAASCKTILDRRAAARLCCLGWAQGHLALLCCCQASPAPGTSTMRARGGHGAEGTCIDLPRLAWPLHTRCRKAGRPPSNPQ